MQIIYGNTIALTIAHNLTTKVSKIQSFHSDSSAPQDLVGKTILVTDNDEAAPTLVWRADLDQTPKTPNATLALTFVFTSYTSFEGAATHELVIIDNQPSILTPPPDIQCVAGAQDSFAVSFVPTNSDDYDVKCEFMLADSATTGMSANAAKIILLPRKGRPPSIGEPPKAISNNLAPTPPRPARKGRAH